MTMKRVSAGVALLAAISLPAATALAAPTAGVPATVTVDADPVPALTRSAYPLRTTEPGGSLTDLRPLIRMTGSARVVGVGEATHNSHEFFTIKHRVFRALVEQRGFTTFSLEASWSTGQLLDRYVLTGQGDPREIMQREFQDAYRFWNVQEYLDLIEWMRAYNRTHHRKLRFVGNDLGYVGPVTMKAVEEYVGRVRPELLPEVRRSYAEIPDQPGVKAWTAAYRAKSLAERRRIAAAATKVLNQLEALPASRSRTWAIQNARVVGQVTKFYAFDVEDPAVLPEAMRFRDQVMADNVVWWAQVTGAKTVLGAHNGHVGLRTSAPASYPKIQGEFLRETLGRSYVAVGLSFDRGSFNAWDIKDPQHPLRTFTLPAAAPGTNEHTLDRVPAEDYVVDLRTVAEPARTWLRQARPTRMIGTAWPQPDELVELAATYDVLVHLHDVTAARLR